MQRPLMRADALNVLLELTTHPEQKIRRAAINTVKLWVPNHQPMDSMIREFALQILRKLQRLPEQQPSPSSDSNGNSTKIVDAESAEKVVTEKEDMALGEKEQIIKTEDEELEEGQENMEDGQLPPEDLIQTPYLPERIELPAEKSHVLQHVELMFALSVKVPEFLDE